MAKKTVKKKQPKEIPTWRCADGRVLKITEMEISHLINTFHMLKRRARDEYPKFMRMHGLDFISDQITVDKFCAQVWPIYKSMREEIANRLRAMPENSVQRKYWHMKFSADSSLARTRVTETEPAPDWDSLDDEPMGRW